MGGSERRTATVRPDFVFVEVLLDLATSRESVFIQRDNLFFERNVFFSDTRDHDERRCV